MCQLGEFGEFCELRVAGSFRVKIWRVKLPRGLSRSVTFAKASERPSNFWFAFFYFLFPLVPAWFLRAQIVSKACWL
jgi:hypothetical protein